jgi:hypothetical protein
MDKAVVWIPGYEQPDVMSHAQAEDIMNSII